MRPGRDRTRDPWICSQTRTVARHVTDCAARPGEEMHLQENTLFDLGVKVTRHVAQYPLHHLTYSATKFEATTSNSLGGDTFTKKVTNEHTEGQTTDQLWNKIYIPFFLKKKAGITYLILV